MTQSCLGGQDNLLVDELSYLGRVTLGSGTTVLHNHINTLARLTGTTLMTGFLTLSILAVSLSMGCVVAENIDTSRTKGIFSETPPHPSRNSN